MNLVVVQRVTVDGHRAAETDSHAAISRGPIETLRIGFDGGEIGGTRIESLTFLPVAGTLLAMAGGTVANIDLSSLGSVTSQLEVV